MTSPESSLLADGWDNYEQFVTTVKRVHHLAAPEASDDFSTETLRYAAEDGIYFYFPHPRDKEEVLRLAYDLSEEAGDVRRSLLVPTAITAAHLFEDGNGRAARTAHAQLAGRSAEEISAMHINGYRNWLGGDAEAQEIIDLRLPELLRGPLEANIYEEHGLEKRISFENGFTISEEGIAAFLDLQSYLPDEYKSSLDETVVTFSPFKSSYLVQLLDPESVAFALNAHSSENAADASQDLATALANLGIDGVKQFVDEVWHYRLLRAKANVACLGRTTLGSQMLSLPDYEEPLSFTEHYIRLSNNLVKDQKI